MSDYTHKINQRSFRTRRNLGQMLLTSAISAVIAVTANAQNAPMTEEVVVTGTRATIRDSINLKRLSTEIVDGMNAEEIGEIPALSIGEALETITGAASHRENGGASEISVRGLGPFLGTTVVNGREATNGSGNRAVNFSIFPSEMFNSIAIHKTQSAKYIEGAVSGQIHLDTRRPIDYGKRRLQIAAKGSAHPDDANIDGQDELGYRGTASYIDSWETEKAGTFGLSFGFQKTDSSNPEQEYATTSGGGRLEACQLASFDNNALPLDTSGRCHDGSTGVINSNIQNIIDADPNDNINSVSDIPFAYIPRDIQFRHNQTEEQREAIFGAFQWQPNDKLDVMVDFQSSERDQKELRRYLQFGSTQENISSLVSNPVTGVVDSITVETDIRSSTTDFQRLEEYEGAGFNIAYKVNDALRVSFDVAYSDTLRTETDIDINMGAALDGAGGSREDFVTSIDYNAAGTDGLALVTVHDLTDGGGGIGAFDINDPSFYTADDRAQVRARQIIRENTINSYRADFSWDTQKLGMIFNVEGGVRFSTLEYDTYGGNRNRAGETEWDDEDLVVPNSSSESESDAIILEAANNCGIPGSNFPESSFLSESRGGNSLVTVENASGAVSSNTWATFDHTCLANTLLQNYGGLAGITLQNGRETDSNDVTEDTMAIYLQANYESEIANMPIRGNFGVRVVKTEIDSVGYRQELTVTEVENLGVTEFFIAAAPAGTPLEATKQSSSYTEVLPSLTFIMDLNDEWTFRAGVFRGMSRPDPDAYGNGRSVDTNDGDPTGYASLEEAVTGISATGNPQLEPLTSWNVDGAIEWYANDDTMISVGAYWKQFQGGYENVYQTENFTIDGNQVEGSVRTTQVSDDKSDLTGLELTATHAFDYLPGFLSGFGVKVSYNYADSNFEFEDGFGGDGTSFDADGNPTELIGIIPAAGLFGLSRHTSSSQLYWQNDRLNIQAIYKARSQYFQAYGRDTQGRLRYVDDSEVFELRMSYKLTDQIKLSLEGLNLLNEPRQDFRAVEGNVNQSLSYGPRVFFGISAKFF
jgi:TonB-dependent receptor